MFEFISHYYYVSLILQTICAVHSIRKGTQQKWLWIIVFIPVIGCLIYIFSEMFTRREAGIVQSGVASVFNPGGKIKTLQENLRFTDTFNNRIELADAYLEAGQTDKAIDLYESSLTGTFAGNEHGNMQLILAYYDKKRFEDLVNIAEKIYKLPQFTRSRANMFYAISLGYLGDHEGAEKEFNLMKGRFSNYEPRYHYGCFLKRAGRKDEAQQVFNGIINEASHLSSNEKRMNRLWFSNAKEALKNL